MLKQVRRGVHRRSDRGATAVLVGLLSVVLMGFAALGVDLGHAFVKKRDTQNQADFSALAGAAQLPGSKSASHPAVLAARDYLNANKPDTSLSDVTAEQLVDGQATDPDPAVTESSEFNGEVYFPSGGDSIRVVAPRQYVSYGLGRIFGESGINMNATATAGLFSPGTAVMPAYAVSGCDYGPQTLTDPATGHTETVIPDLFADDEQNISDLNTPSDADPNPNPSAIDVVTEADDGSDTVTITISGQKLDEVTAIGFFEDGDTAEPTADYILPAVDFLSQTSTTIEFILPTETFDAVAANEALYWIRVRAPKSSNDAALAWSSVTKPNGQLNTLPLRVGKPYLRCAGASNDGNFGTLIAAREDNNKDSWLPVNIAAGLQPPLSLHVFPGSVGSEGLCDPAPSTTNTSIQSGHLVYTQTANQATLSELLPRTNCVDTDTGLPANSATSGLITWTGSVDGMDGSTVTKGRLLEPASPGCPSVREVTIQGTDYDINDDTLTCFFLDDSATVADVSASTYTYDGGEPVISSDIYSSPRFYWVPVLKVKPRHGGAEHYAIVDFRPAFISDQPMTATRTAPATSDNGVKVDGNDVTQISVIFLNKDAIEDPHGGPVIPWLGVGPQDIRLID